MSSSLLELVDPTRPAQVVVHPHDPDQVTRFAPDDPNNPRPAELAILESSQGIGMQCQISPCAEIGGIQGGFDLPLHFPEYPLSRTLPQRVRNEPIFQDSENQELLRVAERIWEGNDLMVLVRDGQFNDHPALLLDVALKEEGSDGFANSDDNGRRDVNTYGFLPLMPVLRVICFNSDGTGRGYKKISSPIHLGLKTIPLDTFYLLADRATHWFLRQHSCALRHFDPTGVAIELALAYTARQNKGFKLWEDFYDASVLMAIFEYKNRNNHEALLRPGIALEAMKKRADAVGYFLQLQDIYTISTNIDDVSNKMEATQLAARVHIRAGNEWAEAERYELLALQHYRRYIAMKSEEDGVSITTVFNPNEGPASLQRNLVGLLEVYASWDGMTSFELGEASCSPPFSEEINIMLTLYGLLLQSGWSGSRMTSSFSTDFLSRLCQDPRKLLKKECHKPIKAKKALLAAFESTTPGGFRTSILKAARPNLNIMIPMRKGGSHQNQSSHRQVRSLLRKNCSQSTVDICKNCSTSGADMMRCPCQAVRYCSKECQLQHWKETHKYTCAHARSNRR